MWYKLKKQVILNQYLFMLEPIGIATVHIDKDELRRDPYIHKEYLDLFCGNWGIAPKSYAMVLECHDAVSDTIDKIFNEVLLKIDPKKGYEGPGWYGLIPLNDNSASVPGTNKLEGYLALDESLHNFLYDPEQKPVNYILLTKPGSQIEFSGKRLENPKIIVTKGFGELKKGLGVWFSDSALQQIRQAMESC